MARIPSFIPSFGPLIGRPAVGPAGPAPSGPASGTGRVAAPAAPVFDPIPEERPDLSGIERPTLEDVLSRALTPDFIHGGRLSPGEFVDSLRSGARLLAELDGDEAALAAGTVGEALQDKETLEACRLLLVKG